MLARARVRNGKFVFLCAFFQLRGGHVQCIFYRARRSINILTVKCPGKIASLVNEQTKPRSKNLGMPITHLDAL